MNDNAPLLERVFSLEVQEDSFVVVDGDTTYFSTATKIDTPRSNLYKKIEAYQLSQARDA